jgi:hypothetical protein
MVEALDPEQLPPWLQFAPPFGLHTAVVLTMRNMLLDTESSFDFDKIHH